MQQPDVRKNTAFILMLIVCGLLMAAPLVAAGRTGFHAKLIPTEPVTYTGNYTLTQSDGSNCRFADAPFTAGSITLTVDWEAGAVSGSLQGGGNGRRPHLRCGNQQGTMVWRQTYSASFSGSAVATSGKLMMNGTLSGSNSVQWEDCTENNEPIDCPADYSQSYSFPVTFDGTINLLTGSGSGAWQVNNIPLPTSGDWTVTGAPILPTATPTATPTDTPTPTATPNLDLTVKNVEFVQVIQCLEQATGDTTCADNSLPLVSYKQTALRVFVGLGDIAQQADGVTARLYGFRNGQEFADSPLSPVNDRIQAGKLPQRSNTSDTLNFRLPHDWLTGNIAVEIEVNPTQSIPENNYANNILRLNLQFVDRPVWRIAYIPITYEGVAPSARIQSAHLFLYKRFPVGFGRLTYAPWPGFEWKEPIDLDTATDLVAELNRRYALATVEVDQLAGWLPTGRDIDPFGFSNPPWSCWVYCPGRVTWQVDRSDGDFTLAHEIAHNLGLRHTHKPDGCRSSDPNTNWPYADSTIQEVGFDPLTMQVKAQTLKDVMTYCSPPSDNIWMSPSSYRKLFEGQWAPRTRSLPGEAAYILVSGVLYRAGGGQFEPAYHFSSTRTYDLPPPGDDYCLALQNDAQQTLAQHCFDATFQDHRTGEPISQISYATVLPNPAGATRIVLQQNNAPAATLIASAHAPTVTVTSPTSGAILTGTHPITWQASDADGDALTYAILYSPDHKASWLTLATSLTQTQYLVNSQELAGGDNAYLRLIASDGFNTTTADSPVFAVTRKAPQPLIFAPEPDTEFPIGYQLMLTGDGYDLEDGALLDEHFQWSSDRDGALGSGRSVLVDTLSKGVHVLFLTVKDSEGALGVATVQIIIRAAPDVFLPVIHRN